MKNKKLFVTLIIVTLGLVLLIGAIIGITNKNKESNINVDSISNYYLNSTIPTDVEFENDVKSGYDLATTFVFTTNIDKDKAIQALKPYMLYKDGVLCHEDYELTVTFSDKYASVSAVYPDKTTKGSSTDYYVIDPIDGVEFAAANPFNLHSYSCVIEKTSIDSNFDVNKIPLAASTVYFRNLKNAEFDLTYEDVSNPTNNVVSESYIRSGNTKYHYAYANARILDDLCVEGYVGPYAPKTSEPEVVDTPKETEIEVKEEANSNWFTDQFNKMKDSFKNGINDFKTNFENSQSFKVITIAASSVIGIALLYVVFVIIRKVWRVVKN